MRVGDERLEIDAVNLYLYPPRMRRPKVDSNIDLEALRARFESVRGRL
jgi:hypothetical protein